MRRRLLLITVLLAGQTLFGNALAEEPANSPTAPFAEQAGTSEKENGTPARKSKDAAKKKGSAKKKSSTKPKAPTEQPISAQPAGEEEELGTRSAKSDASDAEGIRSLKRRRALSFASLLLATAFFLLIAQWLRHWLSSPRLRRLVGAGVAVLRVALFVFAILLGIQLIPTGSDWFWWATIATFVLVAWSVRELFADLIAGIIITAERRIKKGTWISGQDFEGTVERRSLRATWLRDGEGHQITVPNRAMVGAPIVYDSGVEAEHEVIVRLEGYGDASRVRQALSDAVLSSPWVLAGAAPVVLRDPTDPVLWRVRSRLLEPRFAVHFSGELLERVEDILKYDERPAAALSEPGSTTARDLTDDADDA